MNLKKIKSEFKEINDIFLQTENNQLYLKIEVNVKTMKEVTDISKKINIFIDQLIENNNETFILEIYSSVTKEIQKQQ